MAWNTETNKWTPPSTGWTGTGTQDVWAQFLASHPEVAKMGALEKQKAFTDWWGTTGGNQAREQWQTAYAPWQETLAGWQGNVDRQASFTGILPSAPTFSGIQNARDLQLYGEGGTGGLYGLMSSLAAESAAGGAQYETGWEEAYAPQAGFKDAVARATWLEEQRVVQKGLQDRLVEMQANPTQVTPEQSKMIRGLQREQEIAARKQAESMYQETGSYATLQRATDELNRAAVNDAAKMQMEMALQNFSMALSTAEQQSNTLMREIEAGTKSFNDYVQAKQAGVTAALNAYERQASLVMQEAEQRLNTAQTQFRNDMTLYTQAKDEFDKSIIALNAQGDLILQAAAQAMGGTTDMETEINEYYESILQPLAESANTTALIETGAADANAAGSSFAINAVMTALGVILLFTPFSAVGAALIGVGATGLSKVDYSALARGGATPEEQTTGEGGPIDYGNPVIPPEGAGVTNW